MHINLGLPMTVLNVMLPIVKQETTICRLYERWSSMVKWRIDNECYIGLDATGEPELRQWRGNSIRITEHLIITLSIRSLDVNVPSKRQAQRFLSKQNTFIKR